MALLRRSEPVVSARTSASSTTATPASPVVGADRKPPESRSHARCTAQLDHANRPHGIQSKSGQIATEARRRRVALLEGVTAVSHGIPQVHDHRYGAEKQLTRACTHGRAVRLAHLPVTPKPNPELDGTVLRIGARLIRDRRHALRESCRRHDEESRTGGNRHFAAERETKIEPLYLYVGTGSSQSTFTLPATAL